MVNFFETAIFKMFSELAKRELLTVLLGEEELNARQHLRVRVHPDQRVGPAWLKLRRQIQNRIRNLVSISPMFYEQLFRVKIPKAQKDIDDLTVFLRFWDLRV